MPALEGGLDEVGLLGGRDLRRQVGEQALGRQALRVGGVVGANDVGRLTGLSGRRELLTYPVKGMTVMSILMSGCEASNA